ncbi:SPASM domain peptide maturase, grasp-with-spasm system [Chryseobacterium piscicola]|uniref:Grasp-with-spasm system SPASM domain peptide maturase n=1 Tax=Chryseobacterium piscicola TaxID=551459 RepID=A0A1N7KRX7_9FLAO|nr:grasp-with-spasm system SPASM domain peptide maturase [Chryseobacterium piscicola]PQA94979.1 grasp-with-spasm system SPASM domain peptide maturase [Chryseobacterium piscicola]SIS64311.1 SPASM domain peptide maturase, grasp-with-spasm system [Chryseobacterium piscicola]
MRNSIENNNDKLHLLIYPDVIVTKGIKKIILIDSSRNKVFELPVSYFELIEDFKKYTIHDIKGIYDYENLEMFINFIITNDLGFFTDNKDSFPAISTQYLSPEQINNSIIEIDRREQLLNIERWLVDLDNLGCKFYELRFYLNIDPSTISGIFREFKFNSLNGINLYLQFSADYRVASYAKLLNSFPFIKNIFILQSSRSKIVNATENKKLNNEQKIIFSTDVLSRKNCGKVSSDMFFPREINQISENLCFNSCLFKKLSIDIDGNIKNCPSMAKSYGNIKNESIDSVIKRIDFKEYWSVTKDDIKICQDCEYRYICTDCRAYTERNHFNEDNLDISKPLKCGYNPYTSKWEQWSTNPLKEQAIKYYGMQELVKNK